MINSETQLFSTLLEAGVEDLELEELYSEKMETHRHSHTRRSSIDEEDFTPRMPHTQKPGPDQQVCDGHLEKGSSDILAESFHRRASGGPEIKFINPFFTANNCGNRYMTQENSECPPEDDIEAQEVADHFEDWSQYAAPNLVAPGNYLSLPTRSASINNELDVAYQEMSAHIGRRFSMACPSAGGFELPVPGPHQVGNTIQFVMENPSGKDMSQQRPDGTFTLSPSEPGRRHSMGAPHLYCCPWTGCNKVFNRFYNLRSHYRIHSGEKPYTCNYCDASFARNHDLKRHERIHLKTKPFACPTCNKGFSRNDAMNRHVRLKSCSRVSIS